MRIDAGLDDLVKLQGKWYSLRRFTTTTFEPRVVYQLQLYQYDLDGSNRTIIQLLQAFIIDSTRVDFAGLFASGANSLIVMTTRGRAGADRFGEISPAPWNAGDTITATAPDVTPSRLNADPVDGLISVSYTHLTLPTIYSV